MKFVVSNSAAAWNQANANTLGFASVKLPNPSAAPTVAPTGGGSTGGHLAAGTYYARYTWTNAQGETQTSPESAQFTVASGNVPQVTIPALPTGATAASIYLTPTNGASNSETRQATAVTGTTFNLSAAYAAGAAQPASNTAALLTITTDALTLTAAPCGNYAWLWYNGSGGAANAGVTMTIHGYAYLFYDGNGNFVETYTQLTWNGQTSVTLQPGQWAQSDPISHTLGTNANVCAVCCYTISGGTNFPTNWQGPDWAPGDLTTGLTTGVNPPAGFQNSGTHGTVFLPGPVALVTDATTIFPVAGLGDSIIHGIGDSTGNGGIYRYFCNQNGQPFFEMGVGGETAQTVAANVATDARFAMSGYCSRTIIEWGINDTTAGSTAPQLAGWRSTIESGAATHGSQVWSTTLTPHASSTDGFITTANQTALTDNTQRAAFNDSLRAQPSTGFRAGVFDIGNVFEFVKDDGIWIAPGGVAQTPDGTHISNGVTSGGATLKTQYGATFTTAPAANVLPTPNPPALVATLTGNGALVQVNNGPIGDTITLFRQVPPSQNVVQVATMTLAALPAYFPVQPAPTQGVTNVYTATATDPVTGLVSATSNIASVMVPAAQQSVALSQSGGVTFGGLTIVERDAYLAADGRALSFAPVAGGSVWPADLTGWTITFTATRSAGNASTGTQSITAAGVIAVASGSLQQVYVPLTETLTTGLAPGIGPNGYDYDVVATNGADRVTLARGQVTVWPNVSQ